LNCSVCPNKDTDNKIGYIDFNLFKEIVKQIAPFKNVESITLHKNGEPLLHPELPKMIKYIKRKLPSVRISFSTSGLPLNKTTSREILRSEPDNIFISYGNLVNALGGYGGKRNLAGTVSENINNFLRLRQKLGKNKPKITLRFIDKKKKFQIVNAKITKWRNMSDEIEIRPYHTWCGYFKRTYPVPKKRLPCLSLWTTLAINWDGDVSICSLDYAKEGIVGNVKKVMLKNIWHGKKINLYRKKHLQGDYKNLNPCENCTEWRHNKSFWTKENLRKAKMLENSRL